MEGDDKEDHVQMASDVGNQLAKGRHNKDSLVKLLKQAAASLSKLRQSTSLRNGLMPLIISITQSSILHHIDKDVRLLVSDCLTEIIRILAPDTPFSNKVLKDVFKLFLSIFSELGDTSSPYFTRRVKILETIAAVKCCVLMLDIGCENLVTEMFNVFFSVVREDQQSLANALASIMEQIIKEKVSETVVDVILRNLLKDDKGNASASFELAVAVIQRSAMRLEPFIRGYLVSCILERDAAEFVLKEFYHEIIFIIHQHVPQMLTSIIPKITLELITDQVDVRMKAVYLVGKLLAQSKLHVAIEYRSVFIEFLKRFSDKSTEVRMRALECAQACYMSNNSSTAALEILTVLEERLLDTDDKMRITAVSIVCDLAACNLGSFPSSLVLRALDRLRDKKVSVRRKAMQKLLELYHAYCHKCCGGLAPFSDVFEQIPVRILTLCIYKDCKDFRPQNMEIVLAEDLFPADLSVGEKANHWVAFSSFFSQHHRRALRSILSQKSRLQVEMRRYLALRAQKSHSEESRAIISSSLVKMATSFPDSSRAEDFFQKLHQMKDSYIFRTLLNLMDETTFAALKSAKESFFMKIGDRHPNFEHFKILSLKCSHSIFTPEHIQCFLEIFFLKQGTGSKQADIAFDLLNIVISIFPSLLKGSETSFLKLFADDVCFPREKLLQMLDCAIHHVSISLRDVYPFLERICLEGTRWESKVATSVIAVLDDASEHSTLYNLSTKLLGFLRCGQNVPTVLQSLSCIASSCGSKSPLSDEQTIESIFDKIFSSLLCQLSNVKMPTDCSSIFANACQLKVYGLKALVKIFLSQISHARYRIKDLLGILENILKVDVYDGATAREDKLVIRLAAAKAVLKLSSRWDLHVSPLLFHQTILVARAPSPSVSKFLDKIHNLLNQHAIPRRYACAFAIAASHYCREEPSVPEKYLVASMESCGDKKSQSSDDEGAMMSRPEYLSVFLIHVLAHDQSFPSVECEDEEIYARFCWPLVILLQKLIIVTEEHKGSISDVASCLVGIFHAIKKAEDAVDSLHTPKLHILSHIGALVIKHICRDLKPIVNAPQMILLPSSYFKASLDVKSKESEYIRKKFLSEGFIDKIIRKRIYNQVVSSDYLEHSASDGHPTSLKEMNFASHGLKKVAASDLNNAMEKEESTLIRRIGVGGPTRRLPSQQKLKNRLPYSDCEIIDSYSRTEKGNGELEQVKVILEDSEIPSSCGSAVIKSALSNSQLLNNKVGIYTHAMGCNGSMQYELFETCTYKVISDGGKMEHLDSQSERWEVISNMPLMEKDGRTPRYQEGKESYEDSFKESLCNGREKSFQKELGVSKAKANRSASYVKDKCKQRSKRAKLSSTQTEKLVSKVPQKKKRQFKAGQEQL